MTFARWILLLAALALAAGCPRRGPICLAGQTACHDAVLGADVCADTRSSIEHCGACGDACSNGAVCIDGDCACAPGLTACSQGCVNTDTSFANCGGCGSACDAGQVCEAGGCRASCSGATTQCGQSCVDLLSDPQHCGDCGIGCAPAASCAAGGCRYDVVVACKNNGQVVGLQAGTDLLGPTRPAGTTPLALRRFRDVVLVPDDTQLLSQVRASDLAQLGTQAPLGQDARFVLADDPHVYVVNSVTGTLQIFQAGAGALVGADGGAGPGYALSLLKELPLSSTDRGNTYAQGLAKLGAELLVSLQGGFGAAASEGQKVLRVNVADPANAFIAGAVDLGGLDMRAFDGGTSLPRPAGISVHRGFVYVALNNLEPATYKPAGPPLLAKIDPSDWSVTTVDLGAHRCLSPMELHSDGTWLLASCIGSNEYAPTYPWPVVRSVGGGMVVVDPSDTPVSQWALACPEPADGGCAVPVASRFAVVGDDIYLGDQNYGRLFALTLDGGALAERRGFSSPQGPIGACPVNPAIEISNAIDVAGAP